MATSRRSKPRSNRQVKKARLRISAQRERELLSKEICWQQVIPELEQHVLASPDANEALATLVGKSCDREEVLKSLYQYCGGSPDDAVALKQIFADRRRFLQRYSKRLTDLAADAEKVKRYFADLSWTMFPRVPSR